MHNYYNRYLSIPVWLFFTIVIFSFCAAPDHQASKDTSSSCLAPLQEAQKQVFNEQKDGILFGEVRINPEKPLVIVAAMSDSSLLGPTGNTSNLFMGLKQNLPECNVVLLRLGNETDVLFTNQVRALYGPDTGIITLAFLNAHPELKVQQLFIHEAEARYSDHNIITMLRLKFPLTIVRHYTSPSDSRNIPDDQPTLSGKWIVPATLPEIFSDTYNNKTPLEEQKRKLIADVALRDVDIKYSIHQHYAKKTSRIDPAMLAERTMGISYAHDIFSLRNYLLLLARMIKEKNMFPNGITFLFPMHPEFATGLFIISPEPNQDFNFRISTLNSYIQELYPDQQCPRVLLPNPNAEGYIYNSKPVAADEVTTMDIVLVPTMQMPQKEGFFKAMAISAMEKDNWIPPLMSGDGSHTVASALETLTGLPALHDGNIMHLWGTSTDFKRTSPFILNPANLRLIEFIIGNEINTRNATIADIDQFTRYFQANLKINKTRYELFIKAKSLALQYAMQIKQDLLGSALEKAV